MITHLHIESFKCLRDVTIELSPLTVLVGANDSGKSSVLDAIRLLGRTTGETLPAALAALVPEGAPTEALVWHGDQTERIVLDAMGKAGAEFSYHLDLHASGHAHEELLSTTAGIGIEASDRAEGAFDLLAGGARTSLPAQEDRTALCSALMAHGRSMPGLVEIARSFGSSAKYHFDPRALRRAAPPEPSPSLSPSGDNLAAVLDGLLTGADRAAARALEHAVREAFPAFGGVALKTIDGGGGRLLKTIELPLARAEGQVRSLPVWSASDGALLMLAFLALAHSATPEILLIEEPAAGIHPTRLPMLVGLLRAITTGELGSRPRQVIVSTHSSILLNHLRPAEVRIIHRDAEQGTSVTSMSQVPNIKRLLFGGYGMGDLWAQIAEEGLLMQHGS